MAQVTSRGQAFPTSASNSFCASSSTSLRERGNALYKEAASAIPIPVKLSRLQEAIAVYQQSLALCDTGSDRAKCCKNLGQACWSRVRIILSQERTANQINKVVASDLLNSTGFFLDALNHSNPVEQPQEWVQNIHWSLVDIAWAVLDFLKEESKVSDSQHAFILEEMCKIFESKVPKKAKSQSSALIHKAYADYLFQKLESTLQKGDCKAEIVSCLIELCGSLLEIAEDHTHESAQQFLQEIKDLRVQIQAKLPLCKAMEAREAGDLILERAKCLGGNNTVRSELFLSAIDKFKESEALCRKNRDYHAQALSLLSIAHVYNGLSMDKQAETHYQSCISIAVNNLGDKSPEPKWVKDAKTNLQRIVQKRGNRRAKENEQKENMVQGFVLPAEAKEVQRAHAAMAPEAFLRYLYSNHPPRKTSGELGIAPKAALKNAYRKAISQYHPDHYSDTGGWKIVAEEITKYLVMNYNRLH